MAIKAPKWVEQAGAYPTASGWTVDRGKGKTEVVKAAKFNAEEIAEWYGEQRATVSPVQTLHEAPHAEVEVEKSVHNFYSTESESAVEKE